MTRTRLLLAGALLLTLPVPARAQGQTCELLPGASAARRDVTDTGRAFVYVRGRGHWICTGGINVRADSAVAEPGIGELELIGRVIYSDSIKTLTAGWVKYFGEQERVVARENVVLTDRSTGSVIRGPELEYERQTATRPEARTIVRGRPHARFYPADSTRAASDSLPSASAAQPLEIPEPDRRVAGNGPGSAAPDSVSPPLEVDADWMEILGETSFHATGRVELARGEMRGFGAEASFDQRSGELLLRDDARIEAERFTLFGRRINGLLVRDTLREVVAREDALLLAEQLRLEARELRIFFEEGQMNRLVAWSGQVRDSVAGGGARGAGAGVAPRDSAATAEPGDRVAAGPVRDSVAGGGARRAGAGVAPRDSATRGEPGDRIAAGLVRDSAADAMGNDLRARALASGFRLISDSIDVRAPGQRVERVIAVGKAYGERTVDTLMADLPEVASHDWLRGDTIIGYLRADTIAPAPIDTAVQRATETAGQPGTMIAASAANDSAALATNDPAVRAMNDTITPQDPSGTVSPGDSIVVRQVLERIVALGGEGKARSVYRLPEQDSAGAGQADSVQATEEEGEVAVGRAQEDSVARQQGRGIDRPAINYLVAERITLFLEQGQVHTVEAEGPIDGYHLQPRPVNDTTDSARVVAPTTPRPGPSGGAASQDTIPVDTTASGRVPPPTAAMREGVAPGGVAPGRVALANAASARRGTPAGLASKGLLATGKRRAHVTRDRLGRDDPARERMWLEHGAPDHTALGHTPPDRAPPRGAIREATTLDSGARRVRR